MAELDFLDVTTANEQQGSYIKVIGVGGAGTNAVNHMYNRGITGVDFIVCNTDKQSLDSSPVATKIKLGDKDLGAGNDPAVGQQAAISASDKIKEVLSTNTHMLFIAAGMGGGTGTGASPEIAKMAKEIEIDGGNDEILVVAVVTIPFSFEGKKRREQARVGIENLKKVVDSIIVVNTDKLKGKRSLILSNAFALADDVLLTAAKGIAEIMTANAYIHVDFRDVQSVMRHSGVALMGSGVGEGEDRAHQAIEAATTSELLNDNELNETKNILLYVSCSSKEEYQIQMEELETITNYIEDLTNGDVDKIWGYGYDDSLEDKIAITIVATGFKDQEIYHDRDRSNTVSEPRRTESKKEEIEVISLNKEEADMQSAPKTQDVYTPHTDRNNSGFETASLYTNDANVRGITIKDTSVNEQSMVAEEENNITTIVLGDELPKEQPVKKPVVNTVESDDIISLFAKAEKTTPSIEVPEMSSLFAQTKNTEMDEIFDKKTVVKETFDKDSIDRQDITQNDTNVKISIQPVNGTKHSLKDTIEQGGANINPFAAQQSSPETKKDRIKRVHELLMAGKVELLENLRPAVDNIEEKLSQMTTPTTHLAISKDGNVSVAETHVIGSGVD